MVASRADDTLSRAHAGTLDGALDGEAQAALLALAELDARLDREGVTRLTLDPSRERATSFLALGRALLSSTRGAPGLANALEAGLARTADAILTNFPDNLFWDIDALASGLLREALRTETEDPRAHLEGAFDEVVALHALFGRATPIRFRYVHDLTLGFDWAKWVRRAPAERRSVGPFDRAFLRSMLERGRELLVLIQADDAKYPRLVSDRPRNPFVFSREPDHEVRLHRALAARRLIPVRAWEIDATPIWDRAFQAEREALALALQDG